MVSMGTHPAPSQGFARATDQPWRKILCANILDGEFTKPLGYRYMDPGYVGLLEKGDDR